MRIQLMRIFCALLIITIAFFLNTAEASKFKANASAALSFSGIIDGSGNYLSDIPDNFDVTYNMFGQGHRITKGNASASWATVPYGDVSDKPFGLNDTFSLAAGVSGNADKPTNPNSVSSAIAAAVSSGSISFDNNTDETYSLEFRILSLVSAEAEAPGGVGSALGQSIAYFGLLSFEPDPEYIIATAFAPGTQTKDDDEWNGTFTITDIEPNIDGEFDMTLNVMGAAAVPIPPTILLFGSGLIGIVVFKLNFRG